MLLIALELRTEHDQVNFEARIEVIVFSRWKIIPTSKHTTDYCSVAEPEARMVVAQVVLYLRRQLQTVVSFPSISQFVLPH